MQLSTRIIISINVFSKITFSIRLNSTYNIAILFIGDDSDLRPFGNILRKHNVLVVDSKLVGRSINQNKLHERRAYDTFLLFPGYLVLGPRVQCI